MPNLFSSCCPNGFFRSKKTGESLSLTSSVEAAVPYTSVESTDPNTASSTQKVRATDEVIGFDSTSTSSSDDEALTMYLESEPRGKGRFQQAQEGMLNGTIPDTSMPGTLTKTSSR